MPLKDIEKIIYIDAGHWYKNEQEQDPGAVVDGFIERDENMKIRDALVPKLKAEGFEVVVIPDNLDLRKSIDLVNQNAKNLNDGLGISIHLNRDSGVKGGTEVYYYDGSQKSKDMAAVLSRNIALTLGIRDNGARPDTSSAPGSLGFVRQINCWSFVIEVLYLDNSLGAVSKFILDKQYDLIAIGIVNGVKELYGMRGTYSVNLESQKVNILQKLLELYKLLLLKLRR